MPNGPVPAPGWVARRNCGAHSFVIDAHMSQLATSEAAISPARSTASPVRDGLLFVSAGLMAVTLYMVFFGCPPTRTSGSRSGSSTSTFHWE